MNDTFGFAEVQLAWRNHGMPLEGLRYDVTPAGMHYILTHFDIPAIDPETWRLTISGNVANPIALSLGDLRARDTVSRVITMECAGNGRLRQSPRPFTQPWLDEAVSTATWTGTPLAPILAEAGISDHAVEVLFSAPDEGFEGTRRVSFERSLTVADAMGSDALLVYEMDGQGLPPQHGAPVRLIVPDHYGVASVKWLKSITVLDAPFDGYYQAVAYCIRQEPDEVGTPVGRVQPRALMIPPGIPDWPYRHRTLDRGPCRLQGRAWSGAGPVLRVEVSTDGARTFDDAAVVPGEPGVWSRWTFDWTPPGPGEYELVCRATDAAGNVQPLQAPWNLGGYLDNSAQRVPVTVLG